MNLEKLLSELTIDEKIGQLVMINPNFFIQDSKTEIAGPLAELGIKEEQIYQIGSILGIGNATEMIEVQKKYLSKSRHKIPLIFMADVIHGYETIFPVPLALASSWNDDILEKSARIAAKEASTAGIQVTFAPMVDLVRDPRWGRVVESFGEDPYLAERFAKAQVKGFQNDGVEKIGNIAACVKHFAAYGAAEAGKDYNTVDMSRLNLHSNYLRGYKAAINADAKLVMTSFNIFEGMPATTNQYLLKEVLRQQWKFKGLVISDYASLKETLQHGTSENEYDAAVQGLKAGLDIEMATALYIKNLKNALANNDITLAEIDQAVMNVLKLKKDCGLFENPYKGADLIKERDIVRSKEHLNEALSIAEESIVMLKNNGVLPIKNKKIALIGRFAHNTFTNGPWSWHGDIHPNKTLYEALKNSFEIIYESEGNHIDFEKINKADHIILACGEDQRQSGEAHSRSQITLPFNQEELIDIIRSNVQKPITLILFNGRPLDLTNVESKVDAIIEAFYPGTMGTEAIANILTGKTNPSAKLTMSFPRSVGQIPVYYNHLNTGRPYHKNSEYTSFYLDLENSPLYPFGYGLSYSKFEYKNLKLSKHKMTINESIELQVEITNTSEIAGKEIVQLYLRDYVAKISRPLKELIDFKKIELKPKETKAVTFLINSDKLSYFGPDLNKRIDKGIFKLMVGTSSNETLDIDFELV